MIQYKKNLLYAQNLHRLWCHRKNGVDFQIWAWRHNDGVINLKPSLKNTLVNNNPYVEFGVFMTLGLGVR